MASTLVQKWRSVALGNAVLLVVGLPVDPLTVLAAIRHEATASTGLKFACIVAAFELAAVTATIVT